MSRNPPNATLHQQDGSMTAQAFADKEGLSLKQVLTAARRGQLLGARQNPLSKKWWVYPPAKLLSRPRSYTKRSGEPLPLESAESPDLLPCGSAVAVEAGAMSGQSGQYALQVEAAGNYPPASRQAPQGRAECSPLVYRSPAVQSSLRAIREAAARQYREGIHYLRLEGREISQLYAALDRERTRIRKLVGKGLVDVGNLRASDSAWQKLQAMCQQGRLL